MIRHALSLLCLVTGFYALLIYLPFPYHQFIKPNLIPELNIFMTWTPLLIAMGLLFGRRRAALWLVFSAGSISLTFFNVLSSPQPGAINYWVAIVFFAIAIVIQWDAKDWESTVELEAQDAVYVFLAVTWSFLIRLWQAPDQIFWLLSLKLLFAFILTATLSLFRHFYSHAALTAFHFLIYALLFQQLVFPTLSLRGQEAWLAAALLGLGFSLNITAMYRALWTIPRTVSIILLGIWTVVSVFVDGWIRRIDWNGTGQLFFSFASTTGAGILIAASLRDRMRFRFRGYYPYIAGLVVLFAFQALGGFIHHFGLSASEQVFRHLRTASRSGQEDLRFFQFLNKNSNLPDSISITNTPVSFSDQPSRLAAKRPHIFIFVVDSMRRDALTTPEIRKFSKENIAFTNAFTRYGATGLSQPAIWSGAMIPHKQYALPFAPMNSLEKLLSAQDYSQYVSMDEILKQILSPDLDRKELDRDDPSRSFRLCRTLQELETILSVPAAESKPLFVYTQSQDLHISNLSRIGANDDEYSKLVANAVATIDRCFGAFIRSLKQKNLYDQSIVILTSDHGDSLGEEGRFGHAYTLYPEIVRVPLIMHLPAEMRAKFTWRPKELAFTTDIAPTLYKLLGVYDERPRPSFFGVPLADPPHRDGSHLLASSYGPVFALLNAEGTKLYIADGIQLKESLHVLEPHAREVSLDEASQLRHRQELKDRIEQINDFYRIGERGAP